MGGAKQILLTATVLLACNRGLWAQSHIEWVGSWADAQALAARHQRLVLIHFWSPDCVPCQKLDRSVFNQPECVRAVATNYVPWKVNVQENPTVARDLRVDRWPTDVVMTAAGQELYRGASPQETNRYIATLDQIAAHARLGMPTGVSAAPDTGLASAPGGANYASTFPAGPAPAGSAYQPTASYQLPAGYQPPAGPQQPSTTPQQATAYQLPSDYQPANTVYGPPPSNPPPAAPGSQAPLSSAYVTNQWVLPESTAAQPPIAEQRASYMAPSGGAFQPPAGSSPNIPPADAASQVPAAPAAPPFGAPAASPSPLGPSPLGPSPLGPSPLGPPTFDATTPGAPNAPGAGAAQLGPPASAEQPSAPAATDAPAAGLDGYCPVTLVEQEKWVKGDRKWGANHRGRLYFFISPEAQQRFMENFDKYAPALSGYDAVKYSEQGKLVDGKRAHGVFYRGQIYLFSDEAALEQFWTAPERYAATVRAEQQRSAMRSSMQR